MHILITGAAGFLGHHLVAHLLRTTPGDTTLTLLDRLDESGNLMRLAEVKAELGPDVFSTRRVRIVYHDLRAAISAQLASQIVRPGPVDLILHLAAATHVDRSIASPYNFIQDNILGTVNLLEFARMQPALQLFFDMSTDEVFGPCPTTCAPYPEWARYNASNPYSASKAGAEELCVAYARTYDLPVAILHCVNIIGERQHPEKALPFMLRRVLGGETVQIHCGADGRPGSRFYIDAADVCAAISHIVAMHIRADVADRSWRDYGAAKYNISSGVEIDNLSLLRYVAAAAGREASHELAAAPPERPGHDLRYALDDAIMRGTKWAPKHDPCDTIKRVVEWTLRDENRHWL